MPATMHYSRPYTRVKPNLALRDHVRHAMDNFFSNLQGECPENVYHMVLTEVEHPLIESVMHYTGQNQSQAAQILGINRGTFRKKLAFYGML